MKYFIRVGRENKGPFTIGELREFNITPTTRICPEGQGNFTDEQPPFYAKAEKFKELAQLFTESEPNNTFAIDHSEIQEEADDNEDDINIGIPPPIPIEPNVEEGISNPPLPKVWVYAAVGILFGILLAGYWWANFPPHELKKIINCEAKSDSLLQIGEQNIEQSNGESLIAFGLMKDYKNCADKEKVKALKVKFSSQITADEAIINDPDIQKRNTQFNEAIKLLDEIITPNQ